MAFTIDESFLPATLTAPPMTDLEFAEFCAPHPDLLFEMTAEGEIIVMAPSYSLTWVRNANFISQLSDWAEQDRGGVSSDWSSGFVLPNGARRSPDAAWTGHTRIARLSPERLEGFWHLCPDFVIELKSPTDRLAVLRRKMREWMANGAQLAWLIDPKSRSVEIYRPDREPELLLGLESIVGEHPVTGFVLQLAPVWNPLAH